MPQHFAIINGKHHGQSGNPGELIALIHDPKSQRNVCKENIKIFYSFLELISYGQKAATGFTSRDNAYCCAEPHAVIRALRSGCNPNNLEFTSIKRSQDNNLVDATPCVDYCTQYVLRLPNGKHKVDWNGILKALKEAEKVRSEVKRLSCQPALDGGGPFSAGRREMRQKRKQAKRVIKTSNRNRAEKNRGHNMRLRNR